MNQIVLNRNDLNRLQMSWAKRSGVRVCRHKPYQCNSTEWLMRPHVEAEILKVMREICYSTFARQVGNLTVAMFAKRLGFQRKSSANEGVSLQRTPEVQYFKAKIGVGLVCVLVHEDIRYYFFADKLRGQYMQRECALGKWY